MWRAFRRSEKDECSQARGLFSDYMDQRLNQEEAARVEEHLRTCLGCREELESLRATVALLRRLPEVTPSRSFAVAPVRPLPGRRAFAALRFATAGVVLLLVLAFAADRTDLFERNPLSTPHYGASTLDFGSAGTSEEGESYWVVSGEKNILDDQTRTSVDLVVPDGSDNVYVAVDSLVAGGVIYGATESVPDEVPQLVLTEGGGEADANGEAEEYTLMYGPDAGQSSFATNDSERSWSAYYSIIKGQEEQDGVFLNMVPAANDNNVLYSFNLSAAKKEVIAAKETDWLRSVEYGLLGLTVVLGAATTALWLRQRRAKVVEVSQSQN